MRVLAVVLALVVAVACSGDDDADSQPTTTVEATVAPTPTTTKAGITEDEAIAIAAEAYAAEDPAFDFDTRRVNIEQGDGTFDVSWIPLEITEAGGEPHVVVDARTGEVVEIYLTA